MNKLKNILDDLQDHTKLIDRKKNLHLLTEEIRNIFTQIQNCITFKESLPFFDSLEEIELILAQLVFRDEIAVTESIWQFTKDFDRIDDEDLRNYMFREIKQGNYKL